jgi:hypothetical protein
MSGPRRRVVPAGTGAIACLLLMALLCLPAALAANEIRSAEHRWQGPDRLLVRVDLALDLPETLVRALANGVAVDFLAEVRLERRQAVLGREVRAEGTRRLRLAYHALSRQYVLVDLERATVDLAPTLGDGLERLAQRLGRVVLAVDQETVAGDGRHGLAVRVSFDPSTLPLPLQWDAQLRAAVVTQRGWYRWPLE